MVTTLHPRHTAGPVTGTARGPIPAVPAAPDRGGARSGRPRLVVLDGGAAQRVATFRRRRLLVAALAPILVALVALAAAGLVGVTLDALSSAPAPAGPPAAGGAARTLGGADVPGEVVVLPGDTLWSVAARLDTDGDPRDTLASLEAANGTGPFAPGERLVVPAAAGAAGR